MDAKGIPKKHDKEYKYRKRYRKKLKIIGMELLKRKKEYYIYTEKEKLLSIL